MRVRACMFFFLFELFFHLNVQISKKKSGNKKRAFATGDILVCLPVLSTILHIAVTVDREFQ